MVAGAAMVVECAFCRRPRTRSERRSTAAASANGGRRASRDNCDWRRRGDGRKGGYFVAQGVVGGMPGRTKKKGQLGARPGTWCIGVMYLRTRLEKTRETRQRRERGARGGRSSGEKARRRRKKKKNRRQSTLPLNNPPRHSLLSRRHLLLHQRLEAIHVRPSHLRHLLSFTVQVERGRHADRQLFSDLLEIGVAVNFDKRDALRLPLQGELDEFGVDELAGAAPSVLRGGDDRVLGVSFRGAAGHLSVGERACRPRMRPRRQPSPPRQNSTACKSRPRRACHPPPRG